MQTETDIILLGNKLRRVFYGMLLRNSKEDNRLEKIYNEFENLGILDDYEKIVLETESKYLELIEKESLVGSKLL